MLLERVNLDECGFFLKVGFLAWLPHAHLGRLKFKSQTHMCDYRSKFGIFPAALPRSSGLVQIKFNAYNQATQSGLISDVGCALPHPLTYTNHHIDPQPRAPICTDLAMSTSARLHECRPPDPRLSNVRLAFGSLGRFPASPHRSTSDISSWHQLAPRSY